MLRLFAKQICVKAVRVRISGFPPKINKMTLENQYEHYQNENPESKLNFEEWKTQILNKKIQEAFDNSDESVKKNIRISNKK